MDFSKVSVTYSHAIFDDELHEVFFDGGKERFTGVLHQRYHKLQDLCHITNDHEVIGSLQRTRCNTHYLVDGPQTQFRKNRQEA